MFEVQIARLEETEKERNKILTDISTFLNNQFEELSDHKVYCVDGDGDEVKVKFFVDEDGLNIELSDVN
jgi:hypothetical protein